MRKIGTGKQIALKSFFRVVFPRKSQWNAGPVMFNSLKEKSDQTDCQDDHHDQKQVGRKENGPAVHLRRSQSFWNFFYILIHGNIFLTKGFMSVSCGISLIISM